MCNCPELAKKPYPAEVKLFTEVQDGIPSGAGYTFPLTEIVVCATCGKVEFSVPESSRYWFNARHK